MTFNHFNPSNLAFGPKLTTAFTQLNNLADSAEENLEQIFAQQEFLEMYDNRNYPCARPTQPHNPVRSTEFYDLLNDRSIIINKLLYDQENKLIKCDVTLFDRATNRITRGKGETELKEGHCYVKKAVSNTSSLRELTFTEEPAYGQGIELFGFRVDKENNINIELNDNQLHIIPFDCSQYKSLGHGEQLASTNETYVSNDYQCVCVVGNTNNIQVKLNDTIVQQGYGANNVRYCILYLKPDDIVSGSYSKIFKIQYNTKELLNG